MKKTKIISLALVIGVIFLLIGCASTPISQKYPEKWEKTYIGMPLEEFKQVWPEAKFIAGDGTAEMWSVHEKDLLGVNVEFLYFSFQDNKLTGFDEY